MKTGRAYAFLGYEGRWTELAKDLNASKKRGNFSDTLRLMVIDDKVSTMDMDSRVRAMYNCERGRLPEKIAEAAKTTKVYGQTPISMTRKLLNVKPVKASSLRYLVMAEDPEVTDSQFAESLGQGRANMVTAGMLETILDFVAERERKRGAGVVFRKTVFYQDSRGRVQEI